MRKFFSGVWSVLLSLLVIAFCLNGLWGVGLLFYLNPPGEIQPRFESYMWFPIGEWIAIGIFGVTTLLFLMGEKMRGRLD